MKNRILGGLLKIKELFLIYVLGKITVSKRKMASESSLTIFF